MEFKTFYKLAIAALFIGMALALAEAQNTTTFHPHKDLLNARSLYVLECSMNNKGDWFYTRAFTPATIRQT